MKRVAIIFTGGTISMTGGSADGGAVPTLSGADIAGMAGLDQDEAGTHGCG